MTTRQVTITDGQVVSDLWFDDRGAPITAAAAVTAQGNRAALEQQALAGLAANKAWLVRVKPVSAAAQASSAHDQTTALTRQMNALARLLLGDLSGTD